MSAPGKRQVLAAFVSIAGVVAIWAVSAARQEEQTETISRQWIGEQWDITRRCLVGTPIGRGEGAEALRARLRTELVWSVAEGGDPRAPWPARCASLVPTLRADRRILRADPGDALATLEVLAPRVLQPDADGRLSLRDAALRAGELAAPIAILDAAMPSGAEYDASAFARTDLGMPAEAVLASLACPVTARALETLEAPLEGFDEGPALCRAGGEQHVLAARGDRRWWIAPDGASVELTPAPSGAPVLACSDRALVIAWRDGETWQAARCAGGRCAALPPLHAGEDLALALHDERVLAVASATGTDLPLARVLDDAAWSDPVPVARGALSVDGASFRIEPCEGAAYRSDDGRRWTSAAPR